MAFNFHATRPPDAWRIRACQCGFCRRHGARTTSDPAGHVSFHSGDQSRIQRYRFGLHTADFLVCRTCGVYVAAVLTSPRGQFATLNVNTISPPIELGSAASISYDEESPEQRQQRRELQWTPVIGPRSGARGPALVF